MRSATSTLVLAWGLKLLSLGGSDLAAQVEIVDATTGEAVAFSIPHAEGFGN